MRDQHWEGPSSDQSAWYGRIALAIVALVLVGIASWRAVHHDSDLVGFHQAARHWLLTGGFTQEHGAQFYLPAFIIVMMPIVIWPLAVAGALMALLNIALLISSLRMLGRFIDPLESIPPLLRYGGPMLLSLPYLIDTIVLGQVNLLVIWLCLRSYQAVQRRRQWRAGVLIGLGAIVKVYPLIFIGYWLIRYRWKTALMAGLAAVVLALGLSVIGFGWQESLNAHRQWRSAVRGEQYAADTVMDSPLSHHLAFTENANQFHRKNNQSLSVVVRRLTSAVFPTDSPLGENVNLLDLSIHQSRGIYLALAGLMMILLVISAVKAGPGFPAWCCWLAAVIVYVPIYWTHYFVLAMPLLGWLSAAVWRARKQDQPLRGAELLIIAWMVAFPLLGLDMMRLVGVHCWLTLLLVAWGIFHLLRSPQETHKAALYGPPQVHDDDRVDLPAT